MRRLLLPLLLVAAFASEAAAQCGYSAVYVNSNGGDVCGKLVSDSTLECHGDDFTGTGSPPADAVLDAHIGFSTGVLVKSSDGSLAGWGDDWDNWEDAYVCVNMGTCLGGVNSGNLCTGVSQCPGSTCPLTGLKCLGGPDHGTTCTVNADCEDFFRDGILSGTGYEEVEQQGQWETGCILDGTTVTCWGNTDPWATSECQSSSWPGDWGDACTTNSDCLDSSSCITGVAQAAGSYDFLTSSQGTYCGIKTDGSIACWGDDESESADKSGLFDDIPAGTDYVEVQIGWYVACARKTDDSVVCWGDDDGAWGSTTPPSEDFDDIAVVYGAACGVTTSNELVCWGDEKDSMTPSVETNCDWVSIWADSDQDFCAVDDDGDLDCWGYYGMDSFEPMPDPECSSATTSCVSSSPNKCMVFTVH